MRTAELWIDTSISIDETRSVSTSRSHHTIWWIIIVSVILHSLLLHLFSLSERPRHIPPSPPAINAVLYFPPPKKESLKAQETEPEIMDATEPQDLRLAPQTEEVLPDEVLPKETLIEKPVEQKQNARVPDEPISNLTDAPSEESPYVNNNQLGDSTQSFLRHYQSAQNQQLLQNAVKNKNATMYQQQRPKLPFPEELTIQEQLIKKVNCDNSTTKGLAMLSGLLGGTVTCNELPDINSYIDKRLKKNTPN